MKFSVPSSADHIFILGAGASVDYGLPTWAQLSSLIKEKIKNDTEGHYGHKQEALDWIDKVGEKGTYSTIDECISKESVSSQYHTNGHHIENEIFLITKEIFSERYHDAPGGWIRKLNEKILANRGFKLEERIAFVNYNYDHVLEGNFLNFEHLPAKHRVYTHKTHLNDLSGVTAPAFYPHGSLFTDYDLIQLPNTSRLERSFHTMKTGNGEHLDVVSCFDSGSHTIDSYSGMARKLYILGLGNGLKLNLSNLQFEIPVSEVHVTIRDKSLKDGILNFLSKKFEIRPDEIKTYDNCDDLVDFNF